MTASKSTGVAASKGIDTEDTITLTVQIEHVESGSTGIALFTSSWVAPKSDVRRTSYIRVTSERGPIGGARAHTS